MYGYNILKFRDKAKHLNNLTYTDYYYRLMLLSRSVFEWSGLPNEIDEKWIERYLFHHGSCIFFHDKTLGFMVAKASNSNQLNAYDEPVKLTPIFNNSVGGSFKPLKNNEECVLIRNNDIMIPTAPTIELYALRLTEIQRAIDININAQKTPVLLKCTDKQKMTLKQVFSQWNGFEPAIYADKELNMDGVSAMKMDAPIVFDKLQHQKHETWNEIMTHLGINNANTDKRERLVDDEVQANNEQIALSASVMLKSRQLACEQINKIFGQNISVKLRSPHAAILKELEQISKGSEGSIDG